MFISRDNPVVVCDDGERDEGNSLQTPTANSEGRRIHVKLNDVLQAVNDISAKVDAPQDQSARIKKNGATQRCRKSEFPVCLLPRSGAAPNHNTSFLWSRCWVRNLR